MNELWALLGEAGESRYDGEDVTQLAHALQCAALATAEGAAAPLVLAALFHDIGHLRTSGSHPRHDVIGAAVLVRHFPPSVSEPVRLHVEAKRYLARDPAYAAQLSAESQRTLALQGGPFHDDEATAFLARRYADDALRLRRWDDAAKVPDAAVPGLDAYRSLAEAVARMASPPILT